MDARRILVLAAVVVAVVGFFALDLGRFFSLEYFSEQREALAGIVAENTLTAALVFFVVYVVVTALSLPGAAIMTLVGGALFGLALGLLLVSFASSIGATLAFLVSRLVIGDWVQSRFGDRLAALNRGIERDGAFYLFSMRLVPAIPFFVINLLMGLTRIRTPTFYVASQIGMLPGTIVYVLAGTQLATIESAGDILSPGLIGAFLLLAIFPWIAKAIMRMVETRRALAKWERPKSFDDNLIVIGGGSAGLIASLIGATVKAKVTLVERGKMGGDCLNTGCVPSKTLITSGRVAKTLRDGERFGFQSVTPDVNFAKVMGRVQEAIATIEPNDSPERYESLGVNVKLGDARIIDPWTVEVNGERRTARHIVLATGGAPLVPPIPGLADVDPLTSDDVWALDALPGRLLVMGGGPIGCELAQSFARLGAEVTLVDMAPRIMPREDADAAEIAAASLAEDGVRILTGHRASSFRRDGGGGVLTAETEAGETEIAFDRVLVAVGRRPITDAIGLDALGIAKNPNGTLAVNEFLQTSIPTIYACGDVIGPYQFTHMASHQAYYAATNALFGAFWRSKANYSVVPWCTYTEPEVARVGLSEDEAAQQGVAVEVSKFEFAHNDRAIAEDERRGFVKVLTPEGGSDKILGVTIVGPHAGELLAEWTLAMTHKIGLKKIMATIHVYPTLVEANKSAASTWRKKHAPEGLLEWVGRFHALMRGGQRDGRGGSGGEAQLRSDTP